MTSPALVWFRQDLRIQDNPALYNAAKSKAPLLLLYILDETDEAWQPGAASRWWLHYSLQKLSEELENKYNAKLILQKGVALDILHGLIKKHKVQNIYWNRCYEPMYIKRDTLIKKSLSDQGLEVHSYNGALLKEPWEIMNKSGAPFKVFTPFCKTLKQQMMREILPAPRSFESLMDKSLKLDSLALLPHIPWDKGIKASWQPGEKAAKDKLKSFLSKTVQGYKTMRDYPNIPATSRLSPHLHFGELSPIQIWHAAQTVQQQKANIYADVDHFLSELVWREFSTYLLYHYPHLPETAYLPAFNAFPWLYNKKHLKSWQKGLTGYPIVDAGMRELWHIGWMHNRVRMIVASFLIKHLMQPWQDGEAWFWDTLVDADLANNAASWQWVAGSGADAAPYFRIFNPVLQGQKFDKEGDYIKEWVPELKDLPAKYIHCPWQAPQAVLDKAGVVLGKTYPKPIVEHDFARKRALEAYKKIKGK